MLKKERLVWIDQLRAIAFFFVIVGHMSLNKTVESWIYSFHMPLFFMITGLTLNIGKICATDFRTFFVNQFKRLIIPYLWLQFLCLPAICLLNAVTNGKAVAVGENIKGIFVANGLIMGYPSRAMYYVVVLFFAQLCLWLITHITKGDYALMGAICAVFAVVSIILERKAMVWRLNVVPAGVFFIFIGRLLMDYYLKNKEKIEKMSGIKYALLCVCMLAVAAVYWKFNGRVSMAGNKYGESFIAATVSAVLTSTALALMIMKLPKISFLTTVGKSTLLYIAVHKLFITFAEREFSQWKKTLPFVLIVSTAIFFIIIPAVKYCEKFCPYLLGRNTGDDSRLIIVGKIVNIALCMFVPLFFIMHKLFDLNNRPYLIATAVLYPIACVIAFFVLQKLPFVYIQEKGNMARLKSKAE